MNTQVGKSFGIALLLAAGVIAVMLAWNPFTASAAITSETATATSHTNGATNVTVVVSFTASEGDKNYAVNLDAKLTGLAEDNVSVKQDTADRTTGVLTTAQTRNIEIKGNTGQDGAYEVTVTGLGTNGAGPYIITISGDDTETATTDLVADTADTPCDKTVISSCEPGAAVKVVVDHKDLPMVVVGGEFTLDMGGLVIPSVIGEERILIQTDSTKNGFSGNPSDVSVDGSKITLSIPSTKQGVSTPSDPLEEGEYTVTFKQSAGITNPAAAGDVTIKHGDDMVAEGTVQRVIKLSKTSGTRGTETTATLKGFSNGTATVSLVGNSDSLGQVEVNDNVGELVIDTTPTKFMANNVVNVITAVDASGERQDISGKFTISPMLKLDPEETSISKNVTLKLTDWPTGYQVIAVKIGDEDIADTDLDINSATKTIDWPQISSGKANVTVKVPATTNTGTQTVKVTANIGGDDKTAKSATASLKIGVLSLDIQPTTAVPGQEITIQASGFVFEDEIKEVQIGNQTAKVNATANSGGNIVITLKIPSPDTTGAIAIGDGTKTVTVKTIDGDSGRIAEGSIEIPEAAITLSPDNSRRGTTVNASGTGFPSGDLVQVQYDNNGVSVTVAAGSADASGAVSIDFVVPSYARIGTKHDVKAASVGIYKGVTAEATHTTPDAVLTLEPQQAVSGTNMTISGMNFPAFATVSVMKIGTIDVRPVPAPSTSVDGDFESTVLVPQLELGNQTVTITVSSTTITTFLELVPPAAAPTDPAELFAGLGARLLRVWEFDNATQQWSFYDPRPDRADFNSLTEVSSGDIATIIISSGDPIEFQGSNLYSGTNQIVLK